MYFQHQLMCLKAIRSDMKILPQSLIGRTVIVVLAGLVFAQAIAMALYSWDRSGVLALSGERHVADRITMLVKMAEDTPEFDRARMIGKFRGRGMFAQNSSEPIIKEHFDTNQRTHKLENDLRQRLGNLPEDYVRVMYGDVKNLSEFRGMEDGMGGIRRMFVDPKEDFLPLLASVRLHDDSWLNFSVPISRDGPVWRAGFFVPVILANILVICLLVYTVSRLVAPLRLFARAAERLGANMDAPALKDQGPREVRRAVKAFNEMQHRLQEVVHGRTQMLASISHDLRTPITRLRLRAEFIEDEEIQSKVLSDILQIEIMVKSTLDFARDDAKIEEVSRIDLSALLETLCSEAVDAGHDIVFKDPPRILTEGRPVSLQRAFGNLIDNALKYGSCAEVFIEETETDVVVRVEDNGPGIPQDQRTIVFQPFYRMETSRSRETGGTGLGLSVVRDVITAHGGVIILDNMADGGLSVCVKLPKKRSDTF